MHSVFCVSMLSMTDNELQKASDFQPIDGEANFPPPIRTEVVGGMHIAPEVVMRRDQTFLMIEWPDGLPRHDATRTVRFPHGLMRFGESAHECASRLVHEQCGMRVDRVQVIDLDSYVDDADHWHLEPLILADVSGEPDLHEKASGMVTISSADELPADGVWEREAFQELVSPYLS